MTAPRGPSSFKQSDVLRAIKAYAAAGIPREWIRTNFGRDGFTVSVLNRTVNMHLARWDDAIAALERDNG